MAHQRIESNDQRLSSASSPFAAPPAACASAGPASTSNNAAQTVAQREDPSTAAQPLTTMPKRWTKPLPENPFRMRAEFFDRSNPCTPGTVVHWIPLGRPLRTKDIVNRITIRYPDGRWGVPVAAFKNMHLYTSWPHPEALSVIGADMNMDLLVPSQEPVAYGSSPVPEHIYKNQLAIRAAFPPAITKLIAVRPCEKEPATQFTLAHLLTHVASRQWHWCRNVIAKNFEATDGERQVMMAQLRQSLVIMAVCKGWDAQKKCAVWYPELELRIPERSVLGHHVEDVVRFGPGQFNAGVSTSLPPSL
ncbi:hypothetical protein FKP32DRAFT_1670402 [Trametes sanguinea]|nr:hypothetical protein FKP32DRAFT_1670402 [Trametes sanguinea]